MKATSLYRVLIGFVPVIALTGCKSTEAQQVHTHYPITSPSVHASAVSAAGSTVDAGAVQPASSAAVPLGTIERYADQYDEYFVRGDAAISDSPVLANGIRLAAWDGRDPDDSTRVALAAAVYFISVPDNANSIRLDIGYQRADPAGAADTAGFVYVRNVAVAREHHALQDDQEELLDEPGFFGDTFVLPASDTHNSITLDATDRVVDGVLEVHITASAGQVFDVEYIRVTAMTEAAPVVVEHRTVVEEVIAEPYIYTHRYYYYGPWYGYYPHRVVRYTVYPGYVDPFYWGGWITFRASFFTYYPRVYRPTVYIHIGSSPHHRSHWYGHRRPRIVNNVTIVNNTYVYRDRWYRQHFGIDRQRVTRAHLTRHVREYRPSLSRSERTGFTTTARDIAHRVRDQQNVLRHSAGSRFDQQAREWRERPAEARRQLAPLLDRDDAYRQSVRKWSVSRSSSPSGRVTTNAERTDSRTRQTEADSARDTPRRPTRETTGASPRPSLAADGPRERETRHRRDEAARRPDLNAPQAPDRRERGREPRESVTASGGRARSMDTRDDGYSAWLQAARDAREPQSNTRTLGNSATATPRHEQRRSAFPPRERTAEAGAIDTRRDNRPSRVNRPTAAESHGASRPDTEASGNSNANPAVPQAVPAIRPSQSRRTDSTPPASVVGRSSMPPAASTSSDRMATVRPSRRDAGTVLPSERTAPSVDTSRRASVVTERRSPAPAASEGIPPSTGLRRSPLPERRPSVLPAPAQPARPAMPSATPNRTAVAPARTTGFELLPGTGADAESAIITTPSTQASHGRGEPSGMSSRSRRR